MLHKFETKDTKEALRIVKALDMACVLFELGNIKKKYLKYEELSESEDAVVERVFADIYAEIYKKGLVIDDLLE